MNDPRQLALAAALDEIDALCEEPVMRAKLRGLMRGYAARWNRDEFRIDGIEQYVDSDLYNPQTQRTSRSFRMAGKIDLRCTDAQGRPFIMDHKTTSEDIEDPMAAWWKQLVIEAQPNQYMLLEWLNGRKVEYAIWDVVRKPQISPKQITKGDLAIIEKEGTYGGFELTEKDLADLRHESRETPKLYEYRLAQDCTVVRPERYFQRRRLQRLDSELAEYALEIWEHGQEILAARRTDRWMRNSGACMKYGSACTYLSVCSGHDSIQGHATGENPRWRQKKWVHNELVQIGEGNGADLLTNSRIRNFQTCRRQHYYDYELGIERVGPEDKEALIFGTLWHSAQEAYWRVIQQHQEKTHDQHNESANDVDCATHPEIATV